MKKIPVLSTIKSTVEAIKKAKKEIAKDFVEVFQVTDPQNAVSVLKYGLPEIKIIDFADKNINAQEYMRIIESDPWLLFGGVIAVVNKNSEKNILEKEKNPNFLFVITRREFETHVNQIMEVLIQNSQFLYNRRSDLDVNETVIGGFVSKTDPFAILLYANLLSTYLYNTNRLNELSRSCFHTAIMELLLNALEHGNCGITYEEKNKWLNSGKDAMTLIKEKCRSPQVQKKHIFINYIIEPKRTKIVIRDEGDGFDWRRRTSQEFQAGLHGMGIKISQTMVKNLSYNEVGNEVSFEIDNQRNIANLTPAILKGQRVANYKHMQLVCMEGEESEHLYYICSGRFGVYVGNKLISVLTPADIFLGEMAFLLENRRTATIVAIGNCKLIKVEKIKFIHLIETYPHYGIFILKLIVGRLEKQSKITSELKSKLALLETKAR